MVNNKGFKTILQQELLYCVMISWVSGFMVMENKKSEVEGRL